MEVRSALPCELFYNAALLAPRGILALSGDLAIGMKQLLEFIPIALFFVVYQLDGETLRLGSWQHEFDGIFSATAVLIIATALQVVISRIASGYWDKRGLWTFLAVGIFGGATLILRDQTFIQWKPTIFNWALAIAFGVFHFIGERNLLERTLGAQLELPKDIWARLNMLWISNFLIVGGLNLYVAYGYSESTWVSYKLYSAIGFTLLLTVLTALIVSPHLQAAEAAADADSD
ncbi:MAG: intracellular septation protein [Glaciecola sp.]|jgi:intracellular septation protein|uniref:inner membrane-spanning protein YciB n=1 Tax=Congregibacter sp. TaxID=2744308 RepID=UPI0039E50692